MSATSARIIRNGVKTWPHESIIVRLHDTSVEKRLYSPGTPRSRQLVEFTTTAVSAVVGEHRLPNMAASEIGSKLALLLDRLVKLLRISTSPLKIGFLKT